MENKRIKTVKTLLKPQLICDIPVFLYFATFYKQLIKSFSNVAVLLISILKMTASLASARFRHTKINENEVNIDGGGGIGSSRIDEKIVNLLSITKKISFKASFLTFKASLAFTYLKKVFIKTLISYHFYLDHYI